MICSPSSRYLLPLKLWGVAPTSSSTVGFPLGMLSAVGCQLALYLGAEGEGGCWLDFLKLALL